MSDSQATAENKTTTFTGIVIDRGGTGLRAWFVVRNIVDHQGVEIMYQVRIVLFIADIADGTRRTMLPVCNYYTNFIIFYQEQFQFHICTYSLTVSGKARASGIMTHLQVLVYQ